VLVVLVHAGKLAQHLERRVSGGIASAFFSTAASSRIAASAASAIAAATASDRIHRSPATEFTEAVRPR